MVLDAYDRLKVAPQGQTYPRVAFYVSGKGKYVEGAKLKYVILAKRERWAYAFYHDETRVKEDKPSAWQRMLDAIAEGKFTCLVVYHTTPELDAYCAKYHTKVLAIDPFLI